LSGSIEKRFSTARSPKKKPRAEARPQTVEDFYTQKALLSAFSYLQQAPRQASISR